ncbi:hypothetical protein BCR43DRAFT_515112 [Syncephalastrum racemosum]|uniref:Arrestin-like N-terminal domain-containing protein n=1 Tax=Syncephalastrum racemosum TaxID=13706 RepID=A0A1X2HD98_SYNRA|nr:hypothetical protein BCR43DRAFT_515112 [Syncephalastrum racemosum]
MTFISIHLDHENIDLAHTRAISGAIEITQSSISAHHGWCLDRPPMIRLKGEERIHDTSFNLVDKEHIIDMSNDPRLLRCNSDGRLVLRFSIPLKSHNGHRLPISYPTHDHEDPGSSIVHIQYSITAVATLRLQTPSSQNMVQPHVQVRAHQPIILYRTASSPLRSKLCWGTSRSGLRCWQYELEVPQVLHPLALVTLRLRHKHPKPSSMETCLVGCHVFETVQIGTSTDDRSMVSQPPSPPPEPLMSSTELLEDPADTWDRPWSMAMQLKDEPFAPTSLSTERFCLRHWLKIELTLAGKCCDQAYHSERLQFEFPIEIPQSPLLALRTVSDNASHDSLMSAHSSTKYLDC